MEKKKRMEVEMFNDLLIEYSFQLRQLELQEKFEECDVYYHEVILKHLEKFHEKHPQLDMENLVEIFQRTKNLIDEKIEKLKNRRRYW